jgi:hypothetical protein
MGERRSLPLPFLDLLFILLLALLALTIFRQPIKNSEIEQKAEFIIDVTWEDHSTSDIDTWFRAPTGERVWFANKQANIYSLDRDDLGGRNDTVRQPDGSYRVLPINREILTMRGWTPGTYTIALHSYAFTDQKPIKAKVRILRLNPFSIVLEREVMFEMDGQEITIANFVLNAAGQTVDLNYQFTPLTGVPRP